MMATVFGAMVTFGSYTNTALPSREFKLGSV